MWIRKKGAMLQWNTVYIADAALQGAHYPMSIARVAWHVCLNLKQRGRKIKPVGEISSPVTSRRQSRNE